MSSYNAVEYVCIGPVMRGCSLEHEEEVSVLLSSATVEIAKVGGVWGMIDYETQP